VLKKHQREIIGKTVMNYRKKAGFSQETLAEKADIHPNYIGRIERGECSATLAVFLKIAKSLNMRPYKLFLKL
jgi:transcriptional regulator with XRE-family HTH domain